MLLTINPIALVLEEGIGVSVSTGASSKLGDRVDVSLVSVFLIYELSQTLSLLLRGAGAVLLDVLRRFV